MFFVYMVVNLIVTTVDGIEKTIPIHLTFLVKKEGGRFLLDIPI